jgi:acyl-CoA dehydrogenase
VDYALTEQQELLRQTVRRFITNEAPKEYQRVCDEKEQFPHDLWEKLAATGLLGISIDKKYGGMGGNVVDTVIVVEELSRGMFAFGDTLMQFNCFGPTTISFFGNEKHKREYLPKMARGEIKVCLGITESHGGTDALALKTEAIEKEDHYVINGSKMFITGAHLSDYVMLVTRTNYNVKKKSQGISIFMVDMKTKGITVNLLKKVGLHALGTCELFFDSVIVPKENLVGERDKGWYHIVNTLNNERIVIAAVAIGNAQAALDDAIRYTKDRFGSEGLNGQYYVNRHHLVNMFKKIELARLMIYKAAWLQSKGLSCHMESNMAKFAASESAVYATAKGMEIMEGYGYMTECDMQRYWRDAKLFEFAPITNEMVRNSLGEMLGLPRSF